MTSLFTTHPLPQHGPEALQLAKKSSAMRLRGLRQSPGSFSSTYEEESNLTEDQLLLRLQLPKRTTIIAAESSNHQTWIDETWTGQLTLKGPYTHEEYLSPFLDTHTSDIRLSNAELEATFPSFMERPGHTSYWHMTALYVDADFRRRDIGEQLCREAFDFIRQQYGKSFEVRIVIQA